jgi:hypothetical protein
MLSKLKAWVLLLSCPIVSIHIVGCGSDANPTLGKWSVDASVADVSIAKTMGLENPTPEGIRQFTLLLKDMTFEFTKDKQNLFCKDEIQSEEPIYYDKIEDKIWKACSKTAKYCDIIYFLNPDRILLEKGDGTKLTLDRLP